MELLWKSVNIWWSYDKNLSAYFLQRVGIACCVERCIILSVDRLSVTRCYHAQRIPAKIMRSSLEDNDSSFLTVNFAPKFRGEHGEFGALAQSLPCD